jgi:ATP-dependent metalloprotease FtsH
MSMEDAQRFLGVSVKRVRARAAAADDGEAATARRRKPRSTSLTSNTRLRRDEPATFADVAGIGAAKLELMEVVDFFLKPEKYVRSGSKVPRGVLLVGPPGTGKTLLARAVAGEAGVDFFSITASEFVEMFVGVGAARVRSLFEQARAAAPAIVFIDELDAVGRKRGGGGSGNDERDQTLNQLLSELDGFGATGAKRVVVIAATNRPDVLDAALVRPGRFDRKVFVPPPDASGRLEVLRVHTARKPVAPDVDWATLAAETRGFTGAALANLVNVAALLAAREQSPLIEGRHLLAALEAETLGKRLPPSAATRSEELMRRLAVHRAAQALAAEALPELPGVELVSLEPRESSALGFLRQLPDEAREASGLFTAALLRDQLVAALLPRAAEALLLGGEGGLSTLNAPLLAHARSLARAAVDAGFASESSPAIGRRAVAYVLEDGDFVGGAAVTLTPQHLGLAAWRAADAETQQRMDGAYAAAQRLAAQHRPGLEAVALALQSGMGTLTGAEVRALLQLPDKRSTPAIVV